MKENEHNEHHDKDNTGMIIAAIIAIILVVGAIIYFIMGNNDVKDAIDDTTDTIENAIDNDNDTKTAADVAGSYQARVGNSAGIDEDTAADEDDYMELVLSENGTASLVLTTESKDVITGSYTVSNNKIRLTTNNSATNNTQTNEDNNDTNTGDTNADDNTSTNNTSNTKTYEFTIGKDDTLSYMNGISDVTLAKVSNDELKYIK